MKIDHSLVYPQDEHAHMMDMPHGKEKKIDENFDFMPKSAFARFRYFLIRSLAICVFQFYNRVFNGFKIINKKNYSKVKKQGKVIIENHCHFLDSTMTSTMLTKWRYSYICSLPENFSIPVAGKLLRSLGCIPIPREYKGLKKYMNTVDQFLKEDKNIVIAPEGSMWPYYPGLRTFLPGAFKFACRADKPILPLVYIFKKRRFFGKEFKNSYVVHLHVMEPQYPNSDSEGKEKEKELAIRCFTLMRDELLKNYKEGYPNMKFSEMMYQE